jgi:hypothetical protein
VIAASVNDTSDQFAAGVIVTARCCTWDYQNLCEFLKKKKTEIALTG